VFMTSGAARTIYAYWGPYAVSKAALETLAKTYAAETVKTAIKVNLLNPGPIRTRMRAQAMPGEDPNSLPPPEAVAEAFLPLVLPSQMESGLIYDFDQGQLRHRE
jgi:NAD(P)-dependent dehydrogenase (short-subunit alcohol dehydrogenase family)